ncbi:MAG: chromate transporter [Oscillospiraceae bacterium]
MILLRLFYEFFKTGLFSIGGGLATLPFLYDLSDKTGWFTYEQLADMLAVSESTPGPVGVNMATYVGYVCGGIPGAVIATIGLIAPSIIVILIIAKFLQSFGESSLVKSMFYGLRPASVALIVSAGISVVLSVFVVPEFSETHLFSNLLNWKAVALAAVLIVLTRFVKQTKKLHPIVFIALSAVVGVVFRFGGV